MAEAKREFTLTIDQRLIDRYNSYYLLCNPRRRKVPIARPTHESINTWSVMKRLSVNALKQRWKEFIVWWIEEEELNNLGLEEFDMHFTSYMPTRRRSDPDNYVPKFILDGFTESGFIVDDNGQHLKTLSLSTDYDKDNPRTEIKITVYKEKENE